MPENQDRTIKIIEFSTEYGESVHEQTERKAKVQCINID